jgi:hypothetical protein
MQNQEEVEEFAQYLGRVAAYYGFDFEDMAVFDGPAFNVLCETYEEAQGEDYYQDEDRDIPLIDTGGLNWEGGQAWAMAETHSHVQTMLTGFQDYFGPRAVFERDDQVGATDDWTQQEVDEAHAPQYVASWVLGVEYRPVDTGFTQDTSFVRVLSPVGQSQIHTVGLVGQMARGTR